MKTKNSSTNSTVSTKNTVAPVAPKAPIAPTKAKAPNATPPAVPAAVPNAPKEKKARLGLRDRTVLVLERQMKKLTRLSKALATWGTEESDHAAGFLSKAVESVEGAKIFLGDLPADFRRKGAARAERRSFEAGTKVEIAERARKNYEGALEAAEMVNLTVVKLTADGKRIVVTTEDGTRNVLPTAHIREAGAGEARAAKKAERAAKKAAAEAAE
jgi:hypothetical protein